MQWFCAFLTFLQSSMVSGCLSSGNIRVEVIRDSYTQEPPIHLVLYGNKRVFPEQGERAVFQLFYTDPNLSKDQPPQTYQVECATEQAPPARLLVHAFMAAFTAPLGRTTCRVAVLNEEKEQVSAFSQPVTKVIRGPRPESSQSADDSSGE